MADNVMSKICDEDVSLIVSKGILPNNWNPETCKVTYGILSECFNSLEKHGLPQSKIFYVCAKLTNLPESFISEVVKNKPSNLKRSVSGFLAKNPENFKIVFDRFYQGQKDKEVIRASLSCHNISFSLLQRISDGEFCLPPGFSTLLLTNENLLDLSHAKDQLNVSWKILRDWVAVLTGCDDVLSPEGLRICILNLKEKAADLKKHQLKSKLEDFLQKSQNIFSKKSSGSQKDSLADDSTQDMETEVIENLLTATNELKNNLENQIEEINLIRQERNQETTEVLKLRNELDTTTKILRSKEKELQTAVEKIGHFNVRNVNRRIKRMEKKLKDADETINTQEEIILDLSNELLGEKEENETYNCQLNELIAKIRQGT